MGGAPCSAIQPELASPMAKLLSNPSRSSSALTFAGTELLAAEHVITNKYRDRWRSASEPSGFPLIAAGQF